MTTYRELIRRAKSMGHKLTPDLRADLRKLAVVPDAEIMTAARKEWIRGMARDFKVPVSMAEIRLANVGPYRHEPI